MNIRNCLLTSLLVLCSGISSTSMAVGTGYSDDTELFIYDFAKAGDFRPKVLFIFDTSGSMGEKTLLGKEEYDPEFSYPKLAKNDDGSNSFLYYSTGGTPPQKLDSNNSRRFATNKNACATSREPLNQIGLFSSIYWNYEVSGKKGEWKPLKNYASNTTNIVDCQQDISAKNNDNSGFTGSYKSISGTTKGYPVNRYNNTGVNIPWDDSATPVAPNTGGAEVLTIYTANYLRWYYAPSAIPASRLSVAKQALRELVRSTPAVDFGLAVFNQNDGDGSTNKNGGRIIRHIMGNDAILAGGKTGEQDLIDKSNSLTAEGWTPLCETLYEAYRYFGGAGVDFGNDDSNRNPKRDPNSESPAGIYKSPYDKCSSNGYIIYMTDGAPTNDKAADELVKKLLEDKNFLPANIKDKDPVPYGTGKETSYLAALASYMKNSDVNKSADGKQTVTTFTVGFGDEAIKGAGELLAKTASRGGGKYYPATDATQLNEALKSSLLAILKMNTSLVSPAIATNNFDRTRSLNNIYYAMFEPGSGPRWKGNLKKLVLNPDKGYVVDQGGLPAISSDGTILESTKTYWSSTSDGNKVAEGGVQEMLAAKTNRKIYVIPPSTNTLSEFSKSALENMAGGADQLRTVMGLDSNDNVDSIIDWAKGLDAFNEDSDSTTTIREHILGDPLHSRPLVINYGCTVLTGQTSCNPDLRIVMGSNAGFLHMFKDSVTTVDESWAVMPYQFIANQKALQENLESSVHLYGVDASPTVLVNEQVKDGHIQSSQGDKVWLFTGLRGGGKAYYALNISNPDSPSLMWKLDKNSSGFGKLGETWSIPEVAFIPGHHITDASGKMIYKPVLIFSGGYAQAKSSLGQGTEDSEGLGVYIVDAETGSLLFSFTPDADENNVNHKQVAAMVYSMPGSVSVLDSDGDGISDRIYAGDTGGQIWRIDMKGTKKSEWTAIKFASLGNAHLSGDDKKLVDDRRFFTQPVLVRTLNKGWSWNSQNSEYNYGERPFDAVLIGSGDRNRPSSEATTKNVYVMLRDYHVNPTLFGATSEPDVPSSITLDDLYDVTSDPFTGLNEEQIVNTTKALTSKLGWKFWLNESGEKSMGAGLVLQGKLYFTSFLPQVQNFQQCTIQSIGAMRQYMIDMHYGTSFKYVLDSNNQEVIQRYVEVQNKVADDLVIHGGDDGRIRIIGGAPGKEVILKAEGQGEPERCTDEGECSQGAEEAKMDMSPKKIYLYEGEQG
ncbi:PilC/PilY family type IV pilus protein [Aeromonas veronii]|uniref:pilus assembly protein n=1 Tax=Aeromonas veronii TaxID=654 RepID=UPI00209173C3|nr:PilC/PilY family type IV pilus protein [Aeromonas veronii]MCO5341987.1 PilC/PilY family type IV pilus protein [Aeromonas veronii]